MLIEGKNIMSWNVPAVLKGNPEEYAKLIRDCGFDGIMLKFANGTAVFKMSVLGPWPTWGENVKPELLQALEKYGLKVYGWHFLYGNDPRQELNVADLLVRRFRLDGWIWDVETAFDSKPNAPYNARLISKGFRDLHPDIPQGFCWWPLPKNPEKLTTPWHPIAVAEAFLETVDVLMPMMYWGGRTAFDALKYLDRSLKVWDTIVSSDFPMLPIGRAYDGDEGYADPTAIRVFADRIKELGDERNIPGISWWLLDSAYKNAEILNALKLTPRYNEFVIDESKLSFEEVLSRLALMHSYAFPEFFKTKTG